MASHDGEASGGDHENCADVAGRVAGSAGDDDGALTDDPDDVVRAAAKDVNTSMGCTTQSIGSADAPERAPVVVEDLLVPVMRMRSIMFPHGSPIRRHSQAACTIGLLQVPTGHSTVASIADRPCPAQGGEGGPVLGRLSRIGDVLRFAQRRRAVDIVAVPVHGNGRGGGEPD